MASKYFLDPLARSSPVTSAPASATKEIACLVMEVQKSCISYEVTGRAAWRQNSPHLMDVPYVWLSLRIADALITCVLLGPRQPLYHDHQELYIDQCSKSSSSIGVTLDSASLHKHLKNWPEQS